MRIGSETLPIVASALLLGGCYGSRSDANSLHYQFLGNDPEARSYYFDAKSISLQPPPFGGDADKRVTLILRRKSGFTEAVHLTVRCRTGQWRQGAFAGEAVIQPTVPENWAGRKAEVDISHPIHQVVPKVCQSR